MSGKFIVFEGMDGSGKSSAIEMACKHLEELNIPVSFVRLPGGSRVGEQLRSILLDGESNLELVTEFILMQASRIEAYNKTIKPAIDRGNIVLCDRFNTSSYVYQSKVKGLSNRFVQDLIETTTPQIIVDHSILIRRPFDDILASLNKKKKDHFESMSDEKLKEAYDEYNWHASSIDEQWSIIENDGTLKDLEANIKKIINEVCLDGN